MPKALREGGDGEPLFMGVMLRIGELYRTPYFKRHPSKIRKQICHETSCGCKSAMAEAQAFEKNEVERVQAKSTNGKGMLQNKQQEHNQKHRSQKKAPTRFLRAVIAPRSQPRKNRKGGKVVFLRAFVGIR